MVNFHLFPRDKKQWLRLVGRWLAVVVLLTGFCIYVVSTPGKSYSGPFAPLSPEETLLRDRLKSHVVMLSKTIGERHLDTEHGYNNLKNTVIYIANEFKRFGYAVNPQTFMVDSKQVVNLEVVQPGTRHPDEIIVIGAHYDSIPFCPGANDNGSGVAAMLAMAEHYAKHPSARTLKFVAFINEEPPYYQTEHMGSLQYARKLNQQGDNVVGMISLETVGFYSEKEGSQDYPAPFNLFYPKTGNFIGFVGNLHSKKFMTQMLKAFRETTAFPSEGVAAPSQIKGIGWSDHWAFWEVGYPAIMITDTAPFRYPYYHTSEDTYDKLDYERTARVVQGIINALNQLFGQGPTKP